MIGGFDGNRPNSARQPRTGTPDGAFQVSAGADATPTPEIQ